MFNRIFLNAFIKANNYFAMQTLYNNEVVTPQKLYDKTWKVISKEYFEHCLNFCTNVKDTFGDVVKIFDFNSTDIDATFNSNMEEVVYSIF